MSPRLAVGGAALGLLAWAAAPGLAGARTWAVPPRPGAAQRALRLAAPGDTVRLRAGIHAGPLTVDRRVVLTGEPGAVVDGRGRGTVIEVGASGAVLQDLEVRGGGPRALTIDSGVHVVRCRDVTLRRLRLADVLYGVYGERADGLALEDCRLTGRADPVSMRGDGNGVHLWYTSHARITRNVVERFFDGIYMSFANDVDIARNRVRGNARYGLHTMYCQQNRLTENLFTRNLAGVAIMFSNRLVVTGNDILRNRGPRTYGLLLRDCSDGDFTGNRFLDNTVAVFMDNSNRNRLRGNLIQDNGWGLLLFSSCDHDTFAGNAVIHNDYPVALDMRRSDNRFDDGREGNYWSDNAPYDLDGDGVSDVPYSPVSSFAFLSKQFPDLAVLAKSPAVAALSVAERVLPALRPSQAVDRRPRLAPVRVPARAPAARESTGNGRPAWAAVGGFGALALLGLGAVGRGGWRR